ncbi:Sec-independent protein translocase subunit TatA [Arthrobacter sp. GMC3]|uniref:Sec-independent protein translocase subunit TatA n=1 Tax=Arthrobacter sp. GMC3 TaxID=2058894 RepID=UPI000CE37433|nr:Sec-independent protein translocase subunit TatA [Arthrobacter sp. GMC3]
MAIFREPWVLGIIILVAILLFAGPKLPSIARNLGQSMRIIKSEVKEMKNDGKEEKTAAAAPDAEAPVEGKIVNDPTKSGTTDSTGTGV